MLVKLTNRNKNMITQLPCLSEYNVRHRAVARPADTQTSLFAEET